MKYHKPNETEVAPNIYTSTKQLRKTRRLLNKQKIDFTESYDDALERYIFRHEHGAIALLCWKYLSAQDIFSEVRYK